MAVFVYTVNIDYVKVKKVNRFEYDLLFSFVILSSICLCFADDFLQFYLAIELQSLCLYLFASFNRISDFSTESGLKYFVFGAVISGFLLFGFCFIYLSFGFFSFEYIMSLTVQTNNYFIVIGLLFVLAAFLFKIGAAPFHL
jgi:NADH-quinone oxidoreductase subunit N